MWSFLGRPIYACSTENYNSEPTVRDKIKNIYISLMSETEDSDWLKHACNI